MRLLLRCSYDNKTKFTGGYHLIEKTFIALPHHHKASRVAYRALCSCAVMPCCPAFPLGIMDLLGFYQIRTEAGARMMCEEGQRIWMLEHLKGER